MSYQRVTIGDPWSYPSIPPLEKFAKYPLYPLGSVYLAHVWSILLSQPEVEHGEDHMPDGRMGSEICVQGLGRLYPGR